MDHNLIRNVITTAALAAGLPEGRVMGTPSASDNLTLPRPRLEVDILPETFTRSGRKLGIQRRDLRQNTKKELYTVRLDVTCNVLAEDETWLTGFCRAFLVNLPRGFQDEVQNHVQLTATEASFSLPPSKRVGESTISVFSRMEALLHLVFTWRVTAETERDLIQTATIKHPIWGKG